MRSVTYTVAVKHSGNLNIQWMDDDRQPNAIIQLIYLKRFVINNCVQKPMGIIFKNWQTATTTTSNNKQVNFHILVVTAKINCIN